jgi:hypothetical protein
MRLRTFLLLLGLGAIAVMIVGVSWRDRARSARTVASTDEHPASSDEIVALRRDVALLKTRSTIPPPGLLVVPVGEKPEKDTRSAPPDPAVARAQAEEQVRQVTETLERKVATEPVDRSWGDKQSAEIRNAIGEGIAGTRLSSVQCAASLCKVVLQHDTAAAQHEAAPKLGGLPPMRAGVFYHYDEDPNQPRTTLYVLREGFDFHELSLSSAGG